MNEPPKEIRSQPGPQRRFLASSADIGIYGGAARGGKTYALLLDLLRWVERPTFNSVIFRRESTQVTNPGGLWDESAEIYPLTGATPKQGKLLWRFPSGATVKFAHLENESDKFAWQGTAMDVIDFDELTHFSESQFWYLLSRNSSSCGIRPYVRASCNPDPDSFVAKLIEWWIDQSTGYPIEERSGVLRYFWRSGDELIWADTKAALQAQFGPTCSPMSLTFIPSRIEDNKIQLANDPTYLTKLNNLPLVERERLLKGNWLIRPSAGMYFHKFPVVDAAPSMARRIRFWDLAATKPGESAKDPDWTAGPRIAVDPRKFWYIEDVVRFREDPGTTERRIMETASSDGHEVEIGIFRDPAQAGKWQESYLTRMLSGYNVHVFPATKNVPTIAAEYSAQALAGNVYLVRGNWNSAFQLEHDNFPVGVHDDQVAATAGGFAVLCGRMGSGQSQSVETDRTRRYGDVGRGPAGRLQGVF